MSYTCTVAPGSVTLKIAPTEGPFAPWWTQVQFEVFGVDQNPQQVSIGGTAITGWKSEAASKRVLATFPNPAKGAEIIVQYPAR